jgi:radical SAM protein with 4Fe4S-binding SPASM domain
MWHNAAMLKILETPQHKSVQSEDYNYVFNKTNGLFCRYGRTLEDDPLVAPMPEILDIEITTICNGIANIDGHESPCRFCYKGNTRVGKNMSFEIFRKVLDSMSSLLTQIALGCDAKATSNPDIWRMMEYARSKGIIPNITIADISDEIADKLVSHCGACAVSRYANKDICYDSVKKLTDRGLDQTNIHMLLSEETYDMVMETIQDRLTDPRLEKLNAIVFLSLKQKGRGVGYHPLSFERFQNIVTTAMNAKIGFGFDSCSCAKFLAVVKDHPQLKDFEQISDPCEATLFSSYVNVDGRYFPCSFAESLFEGIEVGDKPFSEIWNDPKTVEFRKKLLATADANALGCRECPLFTI